MTITALAGLITLTLPPGPASAVAAPAAATPAPVAAAPAAAAPATPAPATPARAAATLRATAPSSFYVPPSPLPKGRPGEPIRYLRIADTAGARTYVVLYLSRDARNQPIAVSGTVMVPESLPHGRATASTPVVGVGVGTVGLGDSCAASKSPLNISLQVGNSLRNGWILAATDYEGLGPPGPHTYVVGRSEGHAVIDAVRAAERLSVTGLTPSSPVGLWGYSQGGGAVTWAGQLQPSYAPELHLLGIAAGGVPADLGAMARSLDGALAFGVVPMAAEGLDAAYPELKLASYLTPAGKKLMAPIGTECVTVIGLQLAWKTIADLTTTDPLVTAAWKDRLTENSLGALPPRVPIELYHATLDEVVPYAQAHQLMQTYCRAGVNVTWHQYVGEHVSASLSGMSTAEAFLQARFNGKRAVSTC